MKTEFEFAETTAGGSHDTRVWVLGETETCKPPVLRAIDWVKRLAPPATGAASIYSARRDRRVF